MVLLFLLLIIGGCDKSSCSAYPPCCSVTGYDIADICLLTQCIDMHDDDDECSKCLNNYFNLLIIIIYLVKLGEQGFYEIVILKIYMIVL